MNYWQIVLLIAVGAVIGFVLSAKLASRYYISVGMATILHAYAKAAEDLEMYDQLDILADKVGEVLSTKEGWSSVHEAAKNTVRGEILK